MNKKLSSLNNEMNSSKDFQRDSMVLGEHVLRTFQLRAARYVVGIELKEIGSHLGLTKAAISLWEQKNNFALIKTSNENILSLKKLFAERNLFFPDENSISLNDNIRNDNPREKILTRFQLRVSRTALYLTQEELANMIGVSHGVIIRSESLENNQYIRPENKETSTKIKNWLEKQNIIFEEALTFCFLENKKSS